MRNPYISCEKLQKRAEYSQPKTQKSPEPQWIQGFLRFYSFR
jgi:hypothetical protein